MKVLIIYAHESYKYVEDLRNRIAEQYGHSSILRMNARERSPGKKKKTLKHSWHHDASRMMKQANIIVYIVSAHSASNKNVDWEIKKAMKYEKHIVCLAADAKIDLENKNFLNNRLYYYDKLEKEYRCYAKRLKSEKELFSIISGYENDDYIKLFNERVNTEDNMKFLLEQYKLFSDSAEALVTRRQNMNSFYITANTALISVAATVFALSEQKSILIKLIIILALSLPGFLLNHSWKRTLDSYFINNRGKMKVLSMIEKKLPASLYDAEWSAMKNKYSLEKYISFTQSEKRLPSIFIVFYILTDIVASGFLIKIIFS